MKRWANKGKCKRFRVRSVGGDDGTGHFSPKQNTSGPGTVVSQINPTRRGHVTNFKKEAVGAEARRGVVEAQSMTPGGAEDALRRQTLQARKIPK